MFTGQTTESGEQKWLLRDHYLVWIEGFLRECTTYTVETNIPTLLLKMFDSYWSNKLENKWWSATAHSTTKAQQAFYLSFLINCSNWYLQ